MKALKNDSDAIVYFKPASYLFLGFALNSMKWLSNKLEVSR